MYFEDLFIRTPDHPVTVCLMGAGQFGASFVRQAQRIPNLSLRAVCSLDVKECTDALNGSGIDSQNIAVVTTAQEAAAAYAAGKYLVSTSFDLFADLGIEVLVESSGAPSASARAAEMAIAHKMHVIMASKETDSVVGSILGFKANQQGVVYSTGDGDQPSILIGLISWARALGLNIVAAGKSSEYDFIYEDQNKKLSCAGQKQYFDCDLTDCWCLSQGKVKDTDAKRKDKMPQLTFRANPDLCEMVLVSNSTGLKFDTARMHAPVARIGELADIFCPEADGGLLKNTGVLDIFNCLRKPDELSMAGGEFIVVTCDDREIWQVLKGKGHILSADGKYACIYVPRHLMGLETATSVMAAAVMNHATAGKHIRPVSDMLGFAERDLPAGYALKMGGHHHTIDGVGSMVSAYSPLSSDSPVPFYLLSGAVLSRDVPKGKIITMGDITLDTNSTLYTLRAEQEKVFFK